MVITLILSVCMLQVLFSFLKSLTTLTLILETILRQKKKSILTFLLSMLAENNQKKVLDRL